MEWLGAHQNGMGKRTTTIYGLSLLMVTFAVLFFNVAKVNAQEILRIATEDRDVILQVDNPLSLSEQNYLRNLTEGLTRLDATGKVVPGIAKEWSADESGKVYTFKLRESRWSDGTSLTAQDFVNSWQERGETYQGILTDFYLIVGFENFHKRDGLFTDTGIKAIDDYTLEVTLRQPDPYFIQKLSHPLFAPIKRSDISGGQALIMNGPYQWETVEKEHALVKNKQYWNQERVQISKVKYKYISNDGPDSLIAYDYISPEIIYQFKNEIPDEEKCVQDLAATQWLKLNTEDLILENIHLRKALSVAIDREALVNQFAALDLKPTTQLIPPSLEGFEESSNYINSGDYMKAKEFLDQALQEIALEDEELTLTLSIPENTQQKKLAEFLKKEWETHLNIKVIIDMLSDTDYLEVLDRQDYQIISSGWLASTDEGLEFLAPFQTLDTGNNDTGWKSDQFYQKIKQLKSTNDQEARMQLLKEAEALIMTERPIIPLFNYNVSYWTNSNYHHLAPNKFNYLDFSYVTTKNE